MVFSIRPLAVAVGALMLSATAAQAAVYKYQFSTYYDPTTLAPFDTKTLASPVASLTLTDIAGGVQLGLHFKDTDFPGNSKGLYLDELWLAGNNSGTLSKTSGTGGTYRFYQHGFFTPELNRLNWDIDFQDGQFNEGETTTLKMMGSGITVASLLSAANGKAPQIELMNVGAPYSGKWGLNKSVRFIGSVAEVPEPSTYALMGLGLVGIAFVARKRKSAAAA